MDKIDFVVTWVDGNDQEWKAERNNYMPKIRDSGNSENRYRDWELMRYWFRGVEKFAPWVNHIYFVTWGHVPRWLNTTHPKLTVVKHADFIPNSYLPTFSANPIELNIHRIPGLSEQFVLFNDDFFLIDHVKPEDFFKNGKPCEAVLLGQLSALSPEDNIFPHMILNNMSIINKHFSKKDVIRHNWKSFFSVRYGKDLVRNILLYPAEYFSCFKDQHIATSYLKESFYEVWEAEPELLDQACCNRFRTKDDLTHWLVKAWQNCSGTVISRNVNFGKMLEIDESEAVEAITQQRYKMVCLNDPIGEIIFECTQRKIDAAFDFILPNESGFER